MQIKLADGSIIDGVTILDPLTGLPSTSSNPPQDKGYKQDASGAVVLLKRSVAGVFQTCPVTYTSHPDGSVDTDFGDWS